MCLVARKVAELDQKLNSLQTEFADWHQRSEEKQLLEKNYTQIRRVTKQLDAFRSEIRVHLDKLIDNPVQSLSDCRNLELDILEVHRVWQFFRSKLALRSIARFQDYLYAADELAWACYHPAQERVDPGHKARDQIREPPLVFFNDGASPFAASRNQPYLVEEVANKLLNMPALVASLKQLPVSTIGIPWFQIEHLPDGLVIGHEVGHNLEDDFALTDRLKKLLELALKKVAGERQPTWRAWLGEVFADVYGCLATGPAFTGALIDFLAGDPQTITTEYLSEDNWSSYPTAYLRVLLSTGLLEKQGFKDAASKLLHDWQEAYHEEHALRDFERDIPFILDALVDGPYPEFQGAKLSDLLPFGAEELGRATDDSDRLLQKNLPERCKDARQYFAAVRFAYEKDTKLFTKHFTDGKFRERLLKSIPSALGTRGEKKRENKKELEKFDTYDRAAGAKLYQKMTQWRRATK